MNLSKSLQEDVDQRSKSNNFDLIDDIDHIFSKSTNTTINRDKNLNIQNWNQILLLQQDPVLQSKKELICIPKVEENDQELSPSVFVMKQNEIQQNEEEKQKFQDLLDQVEKLQNKPNLEMVQVGIKNQSNSIQETNNINNLLDYEPFQDDIKMQINTNQNDQVSITALSAKMLLQTSVSSVSPFTSPSETEKKLPKSQKQNNGNNSSKNLVSNIHQNIIFEDMSDEEVEVDSDSKVQNQSLIFSQDIDRMSNLQEKQMLNRIIIVCEPEVINEGYITTYKLYRVKSKISQCTEIDSEVLRRFSDFEWLYNELVNKYGGYLIPLLPEKNILTKFNIETADFNKDRQKNLEFFLQKLIDHPKLQAVPELKLFLFAQNDVI